MPIIVSVPKETVPGEQRVALVPELVPRLTEAGLEVAVQSGAGELAGFFDDGYAAKGARLEAEVLDKADIILKVQTPMIEEISHMKEDSVLIFGRAHHQAWFEAPGAQTQAAHRSRDEGGA